MSQVSRVYIIAEAGVNHNGSIEMAKYLVDAAFEAGADAVKFQTFKTEKVISQNAPKAEYQMKTTSNTESQYDMIKKLELDEYAHGALVEYCKLRGIDFLSTPFDIESVNLLAYNLKLPRLKISSGDITNAPLLFAAARTGRPIILSTGMSTLGEVEMALSVVALGYTQPNATPSLRACREAYYSSIGQQALQKKVVLLHCTTEYPAPFEEVNLKAMDTLHKAYNLTVGISDHTEGIVIPIAAVARGAKVVEKHLTLDRNLPGPDHKASLEVDEFKRMVVGIRQVEVALGSSLKIPAVSELKNQIIARKSLVAARPIKKGEYFTEENLAIKRPGNGISPMRYWEWIGKRAGKSYAQDEVI